MAQVSVSKVIRAPKDRVWSLLSDVENWPMLSPPNAKNRVLSHPIVSQDGNTIVCDEYEQAGLIRARHRDRYTLYPTERLEEEIIQGDFEGGIVLKLRDVSGGTLVRVDADITPKNLFLRFLSALFGGGGRILERFWIDLFDHLSSIAEIGCSPDEPMFCPSRIIDNLFEKPGLPPQKLINSGRKSIDTRGREIFNDNYWRGVFPPDSPTPTWPFGTSIKKTFSLEGDVIRGVTSTFDDSVEVENRVRLVDPADPAEGTILEYDDPDHSSFYEILKVVGDDLVAGRAFRGRYPKGRHFLTFTLARRYGFELMNPEDHRDLFEKHGVVPDRDKVIGDWEGRLVSSASLAPPLFRFRFDVDSSGELICQWESVIIFRGGSRVKLGPEQMRALGAADPEDIRIVDEGAIVGEYCTNGTSNFGSLGDASLGLIHKERTSAGTRRCAYYYATRL